MIVELCHVCLLAGITLLCLGFLVHAYMYAHVLCAGDVYLMMRRVRARTRRALRTVRAVPRRARLHQHDGPVGRVALSCKGNSPASSPVTRATVPHGDAPRVVGSAVIGTGPVVPSPRTAADPGPAHTSVTGADAPSRATWQGRDPRPEVPSARGGVLAPAGKGGQLSTCGSRPPRPSAPRATSTSHHAEDDSRVC